MRRPKVKQILSLFLLGILLAAFILRRCMSAGSFCAQEPSTPRKE
ncbi:MAG: hypothetical protein ACOC3Y_01495 [Desulfohalobiaceae bacterium]